MIGASTSASKYPVGNRVKHLLSLLILVAGAGAAWLLYQGAIHWQPAALAGPPGTVIYAAGFDGFADEWQQHSGRLYMEIADGVLAIGGDDGTPYSTTRHRFADFDARVDATAIANPEDTGFGLVFHLQDPENLMVFLISTDGYYRVSRFIDGVEKRLSAWIPSDAIRQGTEQTNRLRVVAAGGTYRFFINDELVPVCIPDDPGGESTFSGGQCYGSMQDALIDETFTSGHIGVAAQATGLPVRIEFDNLVITSPDPLDLMISGDSA
jgi:hypothetical protein